MELDAKWIWDNGVERPRNHWLCFRKCFELKEPVDEAFLHITADSRYIAYVNGGMIGAGPVRGWPSEPFYDSYDIRDCLKTGKNVIAILVTHFGQSTFQYIEGRGGLLAQIDLLTEGSRKFTGTDETWKNHIHPGYGRNAARINCQQPWTEIFDAGAFDEGWKDVNYCEDEWDSSVEIEEQFEVPWKKVKKRDIPFLREEPVYPERVQWVKKVAPKGRTVLFDLKPYLLPGITDSNPWQIKGFVASIIKVGENARGSIRFPWGKYVSPQGSFKINDKEYLLGEDTKEVSIELDKGENYFLMDISGLYHGFFVYFSIDVDKDIEFYIPGHLESGFAVIGPFGESTNTDIWNTKALSGLDKYMQSVQPVLKEHMCFDDVYSLSVYKDVEKSLLIPYKLNNMVIPNQEYGEIPPDWKGDIEVMLDFGKEVSGYIEFELDAPEGTVVDFYGIEYISPDGIIQHTEWLHCTMRYITRGGRQSYRSHIRRGFRYLTVTFRSLVRPVRVYKVFINLSSYAIANIGRFECSDQQLNRIWDISRYTTQLCMEDTFVDCPAYEQTLWVGDARNEALISYYTFGSYELAKRCFKLVGNSLERSPLPESQVPSGWKNVLTAWALFWMSACREYYEYTADIAFLKEIYPYLEEAAHRFLKGINNIGLLEVRAWNMLDWAPMDTPGAGVVTHQNAEFVKALRDIAQIARWLDKEEQASEFEARAFDLKTSINQHLWEEERQAYIDCIHENGERSKVISMQSNIMAYLCDCAEGQRKRRMEEYLLSAPEDFVKIGSPFMSFFYFEALVKLNAGEVMLENIRKNWGGMIKEGATTCWETFPGYEKGRLTRSHCHAWSAAPGYFFGAYLLGILPLEPGFGKVLIAPKLCGLEWIKGSVPVPGGRIDLILENTENGLKLWIDGPDEIEYIFADDIKIVQR